MSTKPVPPPRILIVEDETIVARDIQQQLVVLGYEPVGHVSRGEQAVSLAGELHPDLILMDIQLGGTMDGIAAAQTIRSKYSLPVVFLTAFAEDDTLASAKLTEPFGYILKPFSERELHTVIQMALYKHQVETKLRQSEERLRLVLLGSRDGIWDRDLVKNEVFYSARWWEIIGYEPDELPASPDLWQSLLHPDDADRVVRSMAQVQQSTAADYFEIEFRLRHKAGHFMPVFSRGLVVRDENGRALRLAGTNTDLTERKQAEAKTAQLAAIVESSDDAIVSKDLQGVITSWNKGAGKIFGYAADEMVGTSILRLIPADRQTEEQLILDKIRWGKSMAHFETRRHTKDGRLINVSLTVSPVRAANGIVVGVSKVARDITERVTAEREKVAIEEQLRQSQKLEALGTLAGGIAHDFNNILAGITGFSSLARQVAGDNAEQLDYFDEIDRAGERAAKLVQQIMAFSRADNHTLVPLQMRHVVAEAVQLLRATLPSTIEFEVNLSTNLPAVQGNATQLHQVVMNLGTNAWHAMRDHGGRLGVRLEAFVMDTTLAQDISDLDTGPYVRLTVSDTGCGMDAATQQRVFEPFFTTKAPGEGTGLGLSVLHGIVRNHRGAVRLTSEVDRGTTFEIYLPAIVVAPSKEVEKPEIIPRAEPGAFSLWMMRNRSPVSGP